MSHFVVHVLNNRIQPGVSESELDAELDEVLAPYSEDNDVPEYDTKCYCIGFKASVRANNVADALVGSRESLRERFWSTPAPFIDTMNRLEVIADRTPEQEAELQQAHVERDRLSDEVFGPWTAAREAALADDPQRDQPDPECEECAGTGTHRTTRNPQGYWDWFTVGGRWTGYLIGYDPHEDPTKQVRCWVCQGTGQRNDALGRAERERDPEYTCNGCQGKGTHTSWPTEWGRHGADVMAVQDVLTIWEPDLTPFALVTPDGVWHQKAKMGWFGMSHSPTATDEEWRAFVKTQLEANLTATLVVVDCHV